MLSSAAFWTNTSFPAKYTPVDRRNAAAKPQVQGQPRRLSYEPYQLRQDLFLAKWFFLLCATSKNPRLRDNGWQEPLAGEVHKNSPPMVLTALITVR